MTTKNATDQSRAISPLAEANTNTDPIHSAVISDTLVALRDISATLESLTMGPPAVSLKVHRARYQLDLLKEMLKQDKHQWSYYRMRVAEFDKRKDK